jgi:hypothetical protein
MHATKHNPLPAGKLRIRYTPIIHVLWERGCVIVSDVGCYVIISKLPNSIYNKLSSPQGTYFRYSIYIRLGYKSLSESGILFALTCFGPKLRPSKTITWPQRPKTKTSLRQQKQHSTAIITQCNDDPHL